jgi:hypothetical protein
MKLKKTIRKNPIFELYIEENHLIVNNLDHHKDNCELNINEILNIELIKKDTIINKTIDLMFGFGNPSYSNILKIYLKNQFKEIVLTDCDTEIVQDLITEINNLKTN